VYEFGGGKVREHLGGIYEYLRFHNAESIEEATTLPPALPREGAANAPKEAAPTDNALSYAERKEQQKKINKIQKVYRPEIKSEILISQRRYLDFAAIGDTKKDNVYYQSAILKDWKYFKANDPTRPETGQFEDFVFNGSMIRFKNVLLRMWFRMNTGTQAEQYYIQSEAAQNADYQTINMNRTSLSEQDYVYIRIIIAQLNKGRKNMHVN
jgi:hypothetical protein